MNSSTAADPFEKLQLFPCPACNAQLIFDADKQEMICTHCSNAVHIDKCNDRIRETSLKEQLGSNSIPGNENTIEQLVYKCNRCGSQTIISKEVPTFTCSFCNYEVVNPEAYKTRIVQPAGIVLFSISKQESLSIFKEWLKKGFWAPSNLKEFARGEKLQGIYLPFWTYDAQTNSEWSGYGGRYYYETEYYTDSQGKRQSRQVQRTQWIYRSGSYEHFFDDILIGGANELTQDEYAQVFPYKLNELVNFDPAYLSGWHADVYDINVNEGFVSAERKMEEEIHDACAELCRIDTYRGLEIDTVYSDQTYKHVLLPIWLCSYLYKGKPFHFIINGQTGKIAGKKPVSGWKIFWAVLIALIIVAAFLIFSNQ